MNELTNKTPNKYFEINKQESRKIGTILAIILIFCINNNVSGQGDSNKKDSLTQGTSILVDIGNLIINQDVNLNNMYSDTMRRQTNNRLENNTPKTSDFLIEKLQKTSIEYQGESITMGLNKMGNIFFEHNGYTYTLQSVEITKHDRKLGIVKGWKNLSERFQNEKQKKITRDINNLTNGGLSLEDIPIQNIKGNIKELFYVQFPEGVVINKIPIYYPFLQKVLETVKNGEKTINYNVESTSGSTKEMEAYIEESDIPQKYKNFKNMVNEIQLKLKKEKNEEAISKNH